MNGILLLLLFIFVLLSGCKNSCKHDKFLEEDALRAQSMLSLYYQQHGQFADSDSELDDVFLDDWLLDPWLNRYQITHLGNGQYVMRSAGPDGLLRTQDDISQTICIGP